MGFNKLLPGFAAVLLGLGFGIVPAEGQTTLNPGEVAVLAINANNGGCAGWPASSDEFTFIILKNIVNNTTIDITDNGYERQFAGQWGDSEGTFRMTRTGGALTAGTPITVRVDGTTNAITCTGWSVNPTIATPTAVGTFNLNSGGDQIFFGQGGTWTNPAGANNMTYSGTILYAFNTKTVWTQFANTTQDSGLPPGSLCFSSAPLSASDWVKFHPLEYPTYNSRTARQWIAEFDDPNRWTNYTSCANYNSTGANYASGSFGSVPYTAIPMTVPVPVPGRWTGYKNTDWFDCRNWDDVTVPSSTTNVVIDPTYASLNSCVIGVTASPPTAYANAISVNCVGQARNLTIQNAGVLQVTGNVSVNSTATAIGPAGITLTSGSITGTNLTLTGTTAFRSYFRNEVPTNTAAFNGNVTINAGGYLDLQGVGVGGTLSLTGNYTNNATVTAFDELNSTINFNGTGPQSINTAGFQEEFGYLALNKATNDLTLNAPILLKSDLTLTAGRMMTSMTNLLSMSSSSNHTTNVNGLSFVHGPMVKIAPLVNFQFPVGKGTYLHRISIMSPTIGGPSDSFIAEYFPSDPHVDIGSPVEAPPLYDISYCEYWKLDQYSGTPTARINLGWNTFTNCGIVNPATINVAHWDGTMWRDRGGPGFGFPVGSVTTSAAQETVFAPGGWWTFGTTTAENPLPIELMYFVANPAGKEVKLEWATASEQDNDHFTVERSPNGIDFSPILRVAGAGTSSGTLNYLDYDPWPLSGVSYYRLRQTDYDGTSTLSDVVAVRMPLNGATGMSLAVSSDQLILTHDFTVGSTWELMDATGRLLRSGRITTERQGMITIADLVPGTYVVRLNDGQRQESAPFLR